MFLKQASQISNKDVGKRGPKTKCFEKLSESVKSKRSKVLADTEPLEKLLRAAEKKCHHGQSPCMAKILKRLRIDGEEWASRAWKLFEKRGKLNKPTAEKSLHVKTRLGLTYKKYNGIRKYTKSVCGENALVPWVDAMQHRDAIIPKFAPPVWENGVLICRVTLRDMVSNIISRLLCLEEVQEKLSTLTDSDVDCSLLLSAGVDSATGFSHYNQERILSKDNSLLTECILPLILETKEGQKLWINPNPQSDKFCRAKSMSWQKETDVVTKEIFENFFAEVDQIADQPIVVESEVIFSLFLNMRAILILFISIQQGTKLRVTISAFFSMVDGKAANAIVDNRSTHACPLCVAGTDDRVGPSFFHCRLNMVEWLIRVASQLQVPGNPPQSDALVKAKGREIANKLENHFQMLINRPKIGGSGSCNTGNMSRDILDDPEAFAAILGIDKALVENARLISCLALSSRKLDSDKVRNLYNELEKQIRKQFPFVKKLPPSVHKYSHLPEFIDKLVTLQFYLQTRKHA